jgi:hypothetical protein
MDEQQPPKQADVIIAAVEGVYGPQNTPMFFGMHHPWNKGAL